MYTNVSLPEGMRPPVLPPRYPRTVVPAASVAVLPPGASVSGALVVQAPAVPEAKKRPLRIFSGTYNARGRPERQVWLARMLEALSVLQSVCRALIVFLAFAVLGRISLTTRYIVSKPKLLVSATS